MYIWEICNDILEYQDIYGMKMTHGKKKLKFQTNIFSSKRFYISKVKL